MKSNVLHRRSFFTLPLETVFCLSVKMPIVICDVAL
jgi:hypothetical protein